VSGEAEVLWTLALHLGLTAAPMVAAALLAVRLGARSVPLILALALAASGAVAILAFWAYYASPSIGRIWAFLVLFGSIEIAVWSCYRGRLDRRLLAELRTPLLLWVLGSFFLVYLGFLHGGVDQPLPMASSRFSHQLPSDNDIPQFFSNWFFENGHHGTVPEFPGGWLSSDRPPLQIGYVLSQRAFAWDDAPALHYQVLCVVVQQLWIVGMWAVLCAARLRPLVRGLAILAATVSDVAIVHGFFVWPKLIATAFLLAALALVLSAGWERWRRDARVAGLFAALCALAMLAHGSSAFAIVPLLLFGAMRGMPSWRWLGVAALVGAVAMAPWSAYQRYGDPPGDRLVKWHLGGVIDADERGALETIVDSYGDAGVGGAIEAKWDSFTTMSGLPETPGEVGSAIADTADGSFDAAVETIRKRRFFSLLPFIGIFLLAPLAMLLARTRGRNQQAEWRFAVFCLAFVAVGCLAWGLMLFGGPYAIATLHAGALAVPLLAVCGCVAGLSATFPRFAIAVVVINAIGVLILYTPALTPLPGTSYSVFAAVIAAASLAGFGLVAFRAPPGSDEIRSQGTCRPKPGGEIGTATSRTPALH